MVRDRLAEMNSHDCSDYLIGLVERQKAVELLLAPILSRDMGMSTPPNHGRENEAVGFSLSCIWECFVIRKLASTKSK